MRILLILLFYLTIGIHTSKACTCKKVGDVQKEFNRTDVIVHGKVISKTIVLYSSTLTLERLEAIREKYKSDSRKLALLESKSIIKIELSVIEAYKGNGLSNKIVVYTKKYGPACGFTGFKVGDEFLTYLSSKNQFDSEFNSVSDGAKNTQRFWTNQCTRTKRFDKNEHEKLCELMNG